ATAAAETAPLSLHDALPIFEKIFGETVAPPTILAERRDQVPEIVAELRARTSTPEGKRLVSAIRTIDDALPGEDRTQQQKLAVLDRKSTRLNSSHDQISYAV